MLERILIAIIHALLKWLAHHNQRRHNIRNPDRDPEFLADLGRRLQRWQDGVDP